MGTVGEVHERRAGRNRHGLDQTLGAGPAPPGAWRRAPRGVRVVTVACQPVANCSERTRVAGRVVVTRMVWSPQGVFDTTRARPPDPSFHPGAARR